MILALLAAAALAGETEVMGYSPELNAVFAQVYPVPDDGRCRSFVLDLERKTKTQIAPVPHVAKSVVAVGEDDERSSCGLRAFDAQLELKLKTPKTATGEEKTYFDADWSKPIAGFKDEWSASFGQWLRKARPGFATPALTNKVFELGVTEAEDANWLDAYDALEIATEIKPKLATADSRKVARMVVEKAEKENGPKAALMWEVATRLDPGAARPKLKAAAGSEPARAASLVGEALKLDPILTTRTFREDPAFRALRCDAKSEGARRKLPAALVADPKCD